VNSSRRKQPVTVYDIALRAELMLTTAVAEIERAIAIATSQGALGFERRAAASLSRLQANQL
jgi:hypothetical protein